MVLKKIAAASFVLALLISVCGLLHRLDRYPAHMDFD